jgi:ribonuclease P protein component
VSGEEQYSFLTRPTLKRSEILRGKREFANLFEHGHSFSMGVLKFYYWFEPDAAAESLPLRVAFVVPKRLHKRAVKRNLLKRRMREAYRLNKMLLHEPLQRNQRRLVFLVSYNRPFELKYDRIARTIRAGLHRLAEEAEHDEKHPDISG